MNHDIDRPLDTSVKHGDGANRDPITGAPGSHPLGTGLGAALGGVAAGAVAGSVVGPVGTVIGAAIGAIAGGFAGKGVAEMVDPTVEEAYWKENHAGQPYSADAPYDEFAPAYRYGVDSYVKQPGRKFEDVEPELSSSWNRSRGDSSLEWDSAKHATRNAWNRVSDTVERAVPGDSDRDGK